MRTAARVISVIFAGMTFVQNFTSADVAQTLGTGLVAVTFAVLAAGPRFPDERG